MSGFSPQCESLVEVNNWPREWVDSKEPEWDYNHKSLNISELSTQLKSGGLSHRESYGLRTQRIGSRMRCVTRWASFGSQKDLSERRID